MQGGRRRQAEGRKGARRGARERRERKEKEREGGEKREKGEREEGRKEGRGGEGKAVAGSMRFALTHWQGCRQPFFCSPRTGVDWRVSGGTPATPCPSAGKWARGARDPQTLAGRASAGAPRAVHAGNGRRRAAAAIADRGWGVSSELVLLPLLHGPLLSQLPRAALATERLLPRPPRDPPLHSAAVPKHVRRRLQRLGGEPQRLEPPPGPGRTPEPEPSGSTTRLRPTPPRSRPSRGRAASRSATQRPPSRCRRGAPPRTAGSRRSCPDG